MDGKGMWKIFFYTNPEMYLGGKSGMFGKNAERAANEFEEEIGPAMAVIGGIIIFILAVIGLITLARHIF